MRLIELPETPGGIAVRIFYGELVETWADFQRPSDLRSILREAWRRQLDHIFTNSAHSIDIFRASCHHCALPHGKPQIRGVEDAHFSVSYSGTAVLLAMANKPVGVDFERIGAQQLMTQHLANSILTPDELSNLHGQWNRDEKTAVLRAWVRKEALLKTTGEGLNTLPSTVDAALAVRKATIQREGASFELADLSCLDDRWVGAVCLENRQTDLPSARCRIPNLRLSGV